jgi:hypothetical protein
MAIFSSLTGPIAAEEAEAVLVAEAVLAVELEHAVVNDNAARVAAASAVRRFMQGS